MKKKTWGLIFGIIIFFLFIFGVYLSIVEQTKPKHYVIVNETILEHYVMYT